MNRTDLKDTQVLLVDDNPVNLDVLVETLGQEGYNILVATNGVEALSIAQQFLPDLILLDINMPKMDGYEVCRRLKVDDQTQAIPVLFISALGEVLDKVKAFGAGGVDYITKPFQAEEVLARIRTHLMLRRLQEELEGANKELKQTLEELQATQNQLVMQEKMASLGSLVAGIAHEINTPVGAIHSMHDTLIRSVDKLREALPQEYQDNRQIQSAFTVIADANRVIATGTDRVIGIVNSLRNFARLDEAELQKVDVHEGLDSTLTLIHHNLGSRIQVIKAFGDIPPIVCYPSQLNQVFLNLLVNASQAIQDTGEITISTHQEDDRVHVAIQDTGVGISEDDLKRIFDPGFTTKGVGVGTGLGLSTCYQIVQDHKGEIKVESNVGEGSTFTVILPMDGASL